MSVSVREHTHRLPSRLPGVRHYPAVFFLQMPYAYHLLDVPRGEQVHRARCEPWHMICSVSDGIGAWAPRRAVDEHALWWETYVRCLDVLSLVSTGRLPCWRRGWLR